MTDLFESNSTNDLIFASDSFRYFLMARPFAGAPNTIPCNQWYLHLCTIDMLLRRLFLKFAGGAPRSLERGNCGGNNHLETRCDGLPYLDVFLPPSVNES